MVNKAKGQLRSDKFGWVQLLSLIMWFGLCLTAHDLSAQPRVDLNLADVGQLAKVNGLSVAQANAIVKDRKQRGQFKSPEDVVRVVGVSRWTFRKVCQWIFVGEEAGCQGEEPETEEPVEVIDDADVDFRININAVDVEVLMALPGIGPKRAAQIVERRTAEGPFMRSEDLIKIKGIGPKTLKKLLPFVRVTSDINSVTRQELMSTGALSLKQANAILRARKRRGGFRSVAQLSSVPMINKAVFKALRPFLTHNGEH